MKNKFLPLMMLLCFVWFGGARAAIVEIGNGTNTQNSFPIKTDWTYSLTQQLFTAEEIGTEGTINAISFQYANTNACSIPDIQVYMKNVDKNSFTNDRDMVQVYPSDKVWEGTFSATGEGWITIFLDTPFEYDGTSNLLVCFYSPTNGNIGSINTVFYCTSTTDYLSIAYYSSSYIPDINNVNTYSGFSEYNYRFRANVRFDITPVMIGSPASTTTQYTLPVNMYFNYSLTQQIFTAEEIGTAGTINFLAFDYAYSSSFSMGNVQVYMKNVEKETFESTTDMVAISSSDKVWEGTFSATGMGWVTLTLDTPFEYDGNSNLLVCFYDPTSGYPGQNWKFRTTATTDYQAITYYSDNSNYIPNLNNLSSYSGAKYRYQYRSNIQIGITPDPNWTPCEKPQNLVASVYQGYYYAAWVEWTGGSGLFNVEYKKATETVWTRHASNIGWTTLISALAENTEYDIRVQSVCGTSTSNWVYTTYTTPPACNGVSGLHVSSVSHTSASVSWDAPESGCDCRMEWKKSSDSEWIVQDHIGCGAGFGPGLDSNTSYTVRVLQYCPNGHQSDWEQVSFTTLPDPMTVPFLEEFPTTSIPADWNRYTGLLSDVMAGTATLSSVSSYWYFSNLNGVFDNSNHAYFNIYNTNRKHWLVTPLVNLVEDCLLSFDVAFTAYSGTMGNPDQSGTDDKFVVLVSTNGGVSWQILRQWDNQGSEYVLNNLTPNGETVELDLADYTGQLVQVAFYGESTVSNADNNIHIDNVSIDFKPLCWDMKVNEITLSNITPHAVTIGWDVNGGATSWAIQCSSAPDFQSDLHEIGLSNQYSWTFNDLAPETLYYVRIAPYCPVGVYEPWSDVVTFTTPEACPVPTDVTVTDVTPHGFTVSFTPGGDWQNSWYFTWTTENVAPTYGFGNTTVTEFGVSNHPNIMAGTTYYLWMGIYCEDDETYHWAESVEFTTPYACSKVYTQNIEIDDVQPHEVSLDWSAYQGTATQWQVFYSYNTFLPNNEAYINEAAVTTNEPYVTIDDLAGDTDCHFWIRGLCEIWNGTPQYSLWSDMITVRTAVSCYPPTNVTVSDITSSSAYISWEPGGTNQIEWEVTVESADWGDPYVAIVDEPFLELDFGEGWLEEGEDLPCTVYVSANCGTTDGWSDASETVGFILTDKEQLTVNNGTNINSYVPIYGTWVDKYSKSQFIIPAEDIEDMEYSQISWMTFYAANDYVDWGNARFEVYMMELPCGETQFASATPYNWDDMDMVRFEGSLEIRDGLMVVDFDEPYFYNGGNLLIGFKQTVSGTYKPSTWYGVSQTDNTAIGGYETSKSIGLQKFLPKISFVYDPTTNAVCRKPKDFTIVAVPSDAGTVEFSWTPTDENDLVWIAWGSSNFDPDDPSTWENSAITQYNPGWMAGFVPETTYYFAARTVCDQANGIYSNWTCPFSLTLPEACPAPTNVTITNITSTQAIVNWVDYGDTWVTLYKPVSDETYGFETNTLEGWISEGDATWTVDTGDGNGNEPISAHSGSYNAMITHSTTGNETWLISPTMDLSGLSTAYVEFWYINRDWSGDVDELGVYYRIDGGSWQLLESYTEAHEVWTPERIYLEPFVNNYQIGFKMTDNYGYGVGLDDINLYMEKYNGGYLVSYPEQSVTFTGLEPNTTYWFSMSVNCDGIYSHGSGGPYYFTTKCEAILVDADNPFSEDFESGTFAPDCWDNIPSGSYQWNSSLTFSHSSSHSAYSDYFGNVYLVMPELQLASNASEASLSFWSYNTYPDDFDAGNNAVVLLDGDDETVLWSAGTVSQSWEENTIDLTAYLGQTITLAFKYAGDNGNGWYVDDVEVSVTPVTTVTQTVTLSAGTNWFSTYVDITLEDLQVALAAATPNEDITIKSASANVMYTKRSHSWRPTPANFVWDVAMKYDIIVASDCEITLEGMPINPSEHTITILGNGATTWIGFPLSESMSVEEAFASIAINNDKLKSATANTNYSRGHWQGNSLTTLEPGKGYLYTTAPNSPDRTFTFPTAK